MSGSRLDLTAEQLAEIIALDSQYSDPMNELSRQMMAPLASQMGFTEDLYGRATSVCCEWIAGVVARRLVADQRFMPLVSANDLVNGTEQIQAELFKDHPGLAAEANSLALQQTISSMAQAIVAQFGMSDDIGEAYDRAWRRVDQVIAVARQEGVPAPGLLRTQEGRDALLRSDMTSDEFISQVQAMLRQMPSPEAMLDQFNPMLGQLAGGLDKGGVDSEEMRQVLASMMGPVQDSFGQMRRRIETWLTETVYRVWHVVPEL